MQMNYLGCAGLVPAQDLETNDIGVGVGVSGVTGWWSTKNAFIMIVSHNTDDKTTIDYTQ